jgi:hypothetical protein
VTYKPKFRQGKDKKCWCGSKKKEKNCHGQKPMNKPSPAEEPRKTFSGTVELPGLPGEEILLFSAPIYRGDDPSKIHNLAGGFGRYKVQVLLSKPGFPLWPENEHKLIDGIIGDSHFRITKPKKDRNANDVDSMMLQTIGKHGKIVFRGSSNDEGRLGKFEVDELIAENFKTAENSVFGTLSRFLSAWSTHLDIPLHVHTVQVTELATNIRTMRIRNPHREMMTGGGDIHPFADEYCHYASMYREGLNSNSSFYRFLCFYKIIEGLTARRNRINAELVKKGKIPLKSKSSIPEDREGLLGILREVYPWMPSWPDQAIMDIFPVMSRGKRFGHIKEKLNQFRVGIAHAILDTGEITISIDQLPHVQQINEWLPICRIFARLLLREAFPTEFDLKSGQLPDQIIKEFETFAKAPTE